MALLRGAPSIMKVPHIDLLVVGLPVALLALHYGVGASAAHPLTLMLRLPTSR